MAPLHVIIVLSIGLFITQYSRAQNVGATAGIVPTYNLKTTLTPETHHMSVTGTMTIPVASVVNETLNLELSKVMGTFVISQILRNGREEARTFTVATAESKRDSLYAISLHKEIRPNVTVRFSYESVKSNGFVYSLEGPTYYADGSDTSWYPHLRGEKRGLGTLTFDLPSELTILATGESDCADPRRFHVARSSQFAFIAGKYLAQHADGPIPVTGYSLKERPAFPEYIANVQKVLTILQSKFGRFPHHGFIVAEVPRDQANATGFDGASLEGIILVDSETLDGKFSIPFFGHELSHQWWGNLVTLRGEAGNDMLDEGMAQYGAVAVVSELMGPDRADEFRRDGLPDYSNTPGARGYFRIASAGLDHPLDSLPTDTFVSHEIANTKGMVVLAQLASLVGTASFDGTLKKVTTEYANRNISWQEFLKQVQSVTSKNLEDFYTQWFGRPGAPTFAASWDQNGSSVTVSVRQSKPIFSTPIEISLEGDDCVKQIVTLDSSEEEVHQTLSVPFHVTGLTIDPEYRVMHWTEEFRAEATALRDVTAGQFLENDGKHKAAHAMFENSADNLPSPDVWGRRVPCREGIGNLCANRWKLE